LGDDKTLDVTGQHGQDRQKKLKLII